MGKGAPKYYNGKLRYALTVLGGITAFSASIYALGNIRNCVADIADLELKTEAQAARDELKTEHSYMRAEHASFETKVDSEKADNACMTTIEKNQAQIVDSLREIKDIQKIQDKRIFKILEHSRGR